MEPVVLDAAGRPMRLETSSTNSRWPTANNALQPHWPAVKAGPHPWLVSLLPRILLRALNAA